ncbi:guanosine-3',5'-bis(diphosphate) 3'-pyrophosphohydrolase [Agitococcus lubricus]|uniref:HD domain-containing protein n=1 Tax=Agitococcus lubricus TaxID=1077255 RepID=A0A2T5J029_9GAMM|nr:guanosine-3',5'-bis(diphosphate) 3'-pyrophosphohydrolase [Agitococcus lubricus]PTQ89599.1 HD domain-containing protein [Agitococcus lubricus]
MLISTALQIALHAYANKVDKAGVEYIKHPLRVMAKMHSDEAMAVALLHDVIEDSDINAQDLLAAGLPKDIVDAVCCLTKQQDEDYFAFIRRVKTNRLATQVKIADIEDNINVLRLSTLSDADLMRVQKYHRAWQLLQT